MMNLKTFMWWLYKKIYTYNVFIPEENDYDDEIEEPATSLRRQRYATRVYIVLLVMLFYFLFCTALINRQFRTIIVSPVNVELYNQLYLAHNQTLSCPCSKITTAYVDFVSSAVKFHPICTSAFISQSWLDALYFPNTSMYGVIDFRTTAHAQFRILAGLCAFSRDAIVRNQLDLNSKELVSSYLLHESQVRSEVHASVDMANSIIKTRINTYINYHRITTQANQLVSAFNTNYLFGAFGSSHSVYIIVGQIGYLLSSMIENGTDSSISCTTGNPTSSTGFIAISSDERFHSHMLWSDTQLSSPLVTGFFAACIPFEALLPSTLDCLHDTTCLQWLSEHFPLPNELKEMMNSSALESRKFNASVNSLLENLFLDDQIIKIDFKKYFEQCSPFYCTYATGSELNFSNAIALFISLYGILILILRGIAPFLANLLMKLQKRPRDATINTVFLDTGNIFRLFGLIKRLNLFKKKDDRSALAIRKQRIITRIYLLLLTGSIINLILFHIYSTEMRINSIYSPSLSTYENLQHSYSSTLRCPCTSTSILHRQLISLTPVFHQVCSSDFVTDQWLEILKEGYTAEMDIDWRNKAFSQFRLLSNLCKFANQTVDNSLHRFLAEPFVTANALTRAEFEEQINTIVNDFFQSITAYFGLFVETARLLVQVDQFFMGLLHQSDVLTESELRLTAVVNETDQERHVQFMFDMYGTRDINTTKINCFCATNPLCNGPAIIYDTGLSDDQTGSLRVGYIVSGFRTGCSALESLRLSSLECLYATSNCFLVLTDYIRLRDTYTNENPVWSSYLRLVYNSKLSQYPPNTPLSTILSQTMIEHWDSTIFYEKFYQLCAPNHCSYIAKTHKTTGLGLVVTIISTIDGLRVVLRLILPPLVKFLIKLFTKRNHRQQRQGRMKLIDRSKMIIKKLITLLSITILNLNLFPARNFGNSVNQVTATRLGQWTARLYLLTMIAAAVILGVYNLVQSEALTRTFERPSFVLYNNLREAYGDELACPCASIASTYNQFMKITAKFHQVCQSQFILDQWRDSLVAGLSANLSIYNERDYRRFLSAHLQFLQGLCQLSIQSVHSLIDQFLSSLFVSALLLSPEDFSSRLTSAINQTKLNVPITFNRLLSLTRIINDGNGLISRYGTNFDYVLKWNNFGFNYATTQAVIYDNDCSCGRSLNCTTQAYFINESLSTIAAVKGMKMGCTPSESFYLSTLECFYDQSCLDLIQQYTNYSRRIWPLNQTMGRFAMDATVNKLIHDVFVEEWNTSTNYLSYFEKCSPLTCSNTYVERFNILYAITFFLSLQGGLSIVLKWICPLVVRLILKIYHHRRKRINHVRPISSIIVTPVEHSVSRMASRSSVDDVVGAGGTPTIQCSLKRVLLLMSLLLLLFIVIMCPLYLGRYDEEQVMPTVSSTTTTYNISINSTTAIFTANTTSTLLRCPPTFQQISRYSHDDSFYDTCSVLGDFNHDNLVDVVCLSYDDHISVLLSMGNGSFARERRIFVSNIAGESEVAVGDFNGDDYLDLVVLTIDERYLGVLLGHGDGTFSAQMIFSSINFRNPLSITVSDINGDQNLDIIFVSPYSESLVVFLGSGDGMFREYGSIYMGLASRPLSLVVDDFNNDKHLDIVVVNAFYRSIAVFLGYNNGTFQTQIESFIGVGLDPRYMLVSDFNSDDHPDIVMVYDGLPGLGIMFGFGNGSFLEIVRFYKASSSMRMPMFAADLNGDSLLDIVFSEDDPLSIIALLGDGKGHFHKEILFSAPADYYYLQVGVGDFNNDNHADIISFLQSPLLIDVLLSRCDCCSQNASNEQRDTSLLQKAGP